MTDQPDITSPQNRRVVETAGLNKADARYGAGKIVVEGPHLVREALHADLVPETMFVLDRTDSAGVDADATEIVTVSERVMSRLASTQHPRGPVAVLPMPALRDRPSGPSVVLWGVSDPGNVGTSIRSAAAFGTDIVVGPACADIWNPKVLRAGAGAHFHGTIVNAPELTVQQLRVWGLRVVAAVAKGGGGLEQLKGPPSAVLVGGEGAGLPNDIVEASDSLLTIDMPGGSESLNAGVVASLLAYEMARTPSREPQ